MQAGPVNPTMIYDVFNERRTLQEKKNPKAVGVKTLVPGLAARLMIRGHGLSNEMNEHFNQGKQKPREGAVAGRGEVTGYEQCNETTRKTG